MYCSSRDSSAPSVWEERLEMPVLRDNSTFFLDFFLRLTALLFLRRHLINRYVICTLYLDNEVRVNYNHTYDEWGFTLVSITSG